MAKTSKILSISLLSSCLFAVIGCGNNESVDKDNLVFRNRNIVIENFEGLGVEWGTYEDPDKLSTGAWERSLKIMDRLNPQVVRCMLNYDWFLTSYDDQSDDDKSNDTWEYNFSNKHMNNTVDILRYCDDHDIDVAFGCWNVPGSLGADQYNMFDERSRGILKPKRHDEIFKMPIPGTKGSFILVAFLNSN